MGSVSPNFFSENLPKEGSSNRNVSRASKVTNTPTVAPKPRQAKEVMAPARVQPSRINRSNRMADILANIEDDDDSRAAVPRRRKRQIIESDPEDTFKVPDEIERNPMAPMAPVKKKSRRLNVENPQPPRGIPSLLPLQTTSPAQVPPNFRGKPKTHRETQAQQPQPPAPSNPTVFANEDDSMQIEQG